MLLAETAVVAFAALLLGLYGIWRLTRKLRP
jgi:hypothetical protein